MLAIISLSPVIVIIILVVIGIICSNNLKYRDKDVDACIFYRVSFAITAIIWISIWIVQELRAYSISGTFSADTDFKAAALTGLTMLVLVIIRKDCGDPKESLLKLTFIWIVLLGGFGVIL